MPVEYPIPRLPNPLTVEGLRVLMRRDVASVGVMMRICAGSKSSMPLPAQAASANAETTMMFLICSL
jgi:hypothetical protein